MAKTFRLEIHSSKGKFYESDVEQFNVRLKEGYSGILANHSPITAVIRPGKFSIDGNIKEEGFFSGGVMIFENNQANVVVHDVYKWNALPTSEADKKIIDIKKQLEDKEISNYKKTLLKKDFEFWKEIKQISKV